MGCCQTEGADYFETFAPMNWQTIHILLMMSLLLGLTTKQVDYTVAFVHANIDTDPIWDKLMDLEKEQSGIYIQMPQGFARHGHVLNLKKSLYGLKQSTCNFFLHLKASLNKLVSKKAMPTDAFSSQTRLSVSSMLTIPCFMPRIKKTLMWSLPTYERKSNLKKKMMLLGSLECTLIAILMALLTLLKRVLLTESSRLSTSEIYRLRKPLPNMDVWARMSSEILPILRLAIRAALSG
jgi:hypothetical protein